MAGRPREPIDLIKAKGKKHLSKKEYEERKESELNVPFVDVKPPNYLTAKQKKDFKEYAKKLLALNIFTELDVDCLAQFCIAKDLYIGYSIQIEDALQAQIFENKWSVVESLSCDTETQAELINLFEAILRRQRGDDMTVFMNLQDKAHKQCLACAKELGLTINSRMKLVIPPPPDEDDEL